jgi:hypothetical protein
MTKKDKLTIVPEQAKGRWYHLFVEKDGQNAKVIFPHTDDVFSHLIDPDSGLIKNPEPNHIGVSGTSEWLTIGSPSMDTNTLYFYKDDNVTKDDDILFVPTYKLVDDKYVKQDTGIICKKNENVSTDLIMNVDPYIGGGDEHPMLQFDTRNFSLSNIVATDVQTEDGLFGGIAHTSFEGEYYKVYLTKNVTSLNVWIYGAFVE